MNDLLDRIQRAQIEAGERVVMSDLKAKGLLSVAVPDESLCAHGIPVNSPSACPSCYSDILQRTARELEMYVDLQQKLDYIEYAASTQKELDRFRVLVDESLRKNGVLGITRDLDRYKQALQRANGFLIMHNLEPVKLEYPHEDVR